MVFIIPYYLYNIWAYIVINNNSTTWENEGYLLGLLISLVEKKIYSQKLKHIH